MLKSKKIYKIIEQLRKVGYEDVKVSDLSNILAHQSPMMNIIGYDEDSGGPRYLNGIRVENEDGLPTFILYFSEYPKQNSSIWDIQNYDEKVAEQKNRAADMDKASKDHMKGFK